MSDANPKDIAGRAKPQFHLVPVTVGLVRVMELGASKYGPYNWRDKSVTHTAYISAAMRHLRAFLDGESVDPESGALHIEHAAAGLLILADAMACGTAKDDRPQSARSPG